MSRITTIEIPEGMTPEQAQRALAAQPPARQVAPPPRSSSGRAPAAEPLLLPSEVATMFRVDPKTVTRWARAGKLTAVWTLGGHRRYREVEVRALLAGTPQERAA